MLAALIAALSLQAAEAPVDDVLKGSPSGLCVLVGGGDGSLAERVARGGRWIVHVLEPDEKNVHPLRMMLDSRGLSGLA